jgi:hypothetical protein
MYLPYVDDELNKLKSLPPLSKVIEDVELPLPPIGRLVSWTSQ